MDDKQNTKLVDATKAVVGKIGDALVEECRTQAGGDERVGFQMLSLALMSMMTSTVKTLTEGDENGEVDVATLVAFDTATSKLLRPALEELAEIAEALRPILDKIKTR